MRSGLPPLLNRVLAVIAIQLAAGAAGAAAKDAKAFQSAPVDEPAFDRSVQTLFYKARSPRTGNMWDTWLYLHEGNYYLYSLAMGRGRPSFSPSRRTSFIGHASAASTNSSRTKGGIRETVAGTASGLSRAPAADSTATGPLRRRPKREGDSDSAKHWTSPPADSPFRLAAEVE